MEKDKSPIHSTNICLGVMSDESRKTAVSKAQPAILLISGDFGFRSDSALKICAPQWNDFFNANKFELTFAVEQNLPEYIKPFFLEYPVESINDFSIENIMEKTPYLSPFKTARAVTEELRLSRIDKSEAYNRIEALQLPQSLKNSILIGLKLNPNRDTPSSNPHQIDSILSMMDIQEESEEPQSRTDEFVSAVTSKDTSGPDYGSVKNFLAKIIEKTAEAIRKTERFTEIARSWHSLKNIVKIAGRNAIVDIYCASSPREKAAELLPSLLDSIPDNMTPDLLLWNYDYSLSTASMQELEQISMIADRYKTVLCTSLNSSEEINSVLYTTQPARIVMEHDQMIPYKRFRSNTASRSCILCSAPQYTESNISEFSLASGAWIITAQWMTSLVESGNPFQWPQRIQSVNGFGTTSKVDDSRIEEVAQYGITITENCDFLHRVSPVSVIDISGDSPYRSAGFNILVNKTARLAAARVSAAGITSEDAASVLYDYLFTILKPYHILSSDAALSVDISNNVATIELNSECTIDGFAILFQFSINL
jgi:predicted component of type VI protein secretion system